MFDERDSVEIIGQGEQRVFCENCESEYIYIVTRTVWVAVANPLGSLSSREIQRHAEQMAEPKLAAALKTAELVACPKCGSFPNELVRSVKAGNVRKFLRNTWHVSLLAVLICVAMAQTQGFGPLIIVATVATVVGTIVILRIRLHNPNEPGDRETVSQRAANSKAISLDEYNARQSVADEQGASRMQNNGKNSGDSSTR